MVLPLLTITCVLRSGGEYEPKHVTRLWHAVRGNLSVQHRFVALSDLPVDCDRIELLCGWPGWWSKIELFRSGLFDGPVLYLDLDVAITGDLAPFVREPIKFTMLRSFWPNRDVNSSMMAWSEDLSPIYRHFAANPDRWMAAYRTERQWGDQDFIADFSPVRPRYWQDICRGMVQSYKLGVLRRGLGSDTRIVIFHGRPKPWDMQFDGKIIA